jgi:hypothetical protein
MRYRQPKMIIFNEDVIDAARDGHGDRLGWICRIELTPYVNEEYGASECLRMLSNVIKLLDQHYRDIYEFGEQSGCWIYWRQEENIIEVLHKYWDAKQLYLFREILIAMSMTHGWIWHSIGEGTDACMAMS